MNARTASRLLSLLALSTAISCGDVQPATVLAPSSSVQLAMAANATRVYTALGVGISYSVTGPFHDVITFTAPNAGAYQVSVLGNTQIVGCSGRYCRSPGTLKAIVSGVQIQSASGAPIATIVGKSTVSLAAGAYQLVVDGAGVGTGRYLNTGNYTVTIRPPVISIPSCDTVAAQLAAQGYTQAQIDAYITALLAKSPPGCIND